MRPFCDKRVKVSVWLAWHPRLLHYLCCDPYLSVQVMCIEVFDDKSKSVKLVVVICPAVSLVGLLLFLSTPFAF